jgi:hypothetical protein
MATLLKYQMTCGDEEKCGKTYVVLVDADEPIVPDTCPFCGEKASESDGE